MEKPIIEIRSISKKYDIAHMRGGYIALRDVLTDIAKHPLSFMAKRARRAVGLEKKEEFWALKGVSFNVRRGEVVGVIGANGAGKSTLLKILSQITPPTEGEVIIRGRVGSLLEVGTGFHPELTGRENIFLNGAILGMKRSEIASKFGEIVSFAGVEKFLDTPVKYYSSGMYVRLAFSVAAHMEPDILIVDEVLAVGDAEFQKKCLGKMDEITKKAGRTILFVSHNMAAVRELCDRVVLLRGGRIAMAGETDEVIVEYLKESKSSVALTSRTDRKGDGRLRVSDAYFTDKKGQHIHEIPSGTAVSLVIEYSTADPELKKADISIGIDSADQTRIALISSSVMGSSVMIDPNGGAIKIDIDSLPLNQGDYLYTIFIEKNGIILDWIRGAGRFTVIPGNFYPSGIMPRQGSLLLNYDIQSR